MEWGRMGEGGGMVRLGAKGGQRTGLGLVVVDGRKMTAKER